MKALTLWQPWASLCVLMKPCDICAGPAGPPIAQPFCDGCRPFKTIETRSWPAPKALIGQRIAIHAAKRTPSDCVVEVGEIEMIRHFWTGPGSLPAGWSIQHPDVDGVLVDPVPFGAIVGTAVLTDCVPITNHPSSGKHTIVNRGMRRLFDDNGRGCVDVSDQLPFGDFAPGRWAWLLADAEPCDLIPAVGRQGVWNWTA